MNKTTSERFGYKSSSEMPLDNRVIPLLLINIYFYEAERKPKYESRNCL